MNNGNEPPAHTITLTVNGEAHTLSCDDRQLLVEAIRDRLGLRGTRAGCLSGDCGACTVDMDGKIIKSCLVLAVSADGSSIRTIEGLGTLGALSDLQQAFWDVDGFQCGFCLPGHLFAPPAGWRWLVASDHDARIAIPSARCNLQTSA